MAEGARLESVYTARYRGFESLPHRHILKNRSSSGFFVSDVYLRVGREGENPRLGSTARSASTEERRPEGRIIPPSQLMRIHAASALVRQCTSPPYFKKPLK